MIKRTLLLTVFAFSGALAAFAQTADTSDYGKLKLGADPSTYDSLAEKLLHHNNEQYYEDFRTEFIDIDLEGVDPKAEVSDDVYSKRIKMMATEIQLPYNEIVQRYLKVYTRPNATMSHVLGMGQYYFPIIEEALYRHGLPMELKMLPVIESALKVRARSHASAVGLWQFMLPTGKYYGLEINSFIDERQDPVKSTEAACKYLKDLYKMYGDWTLVIAAYNCGQGRVNSAIRRVPNAQSYWDIWEFLPSETRNYVPIFIAASYAYTFHKAHGIEPDDLSLPLAVDTVTVDRLLHLDQVSSVLGVNPEIIRELNPQYLKDIVPATDTNYKLVLPLAAASRYEVELDSIHARDSIYLGNYQKVENLKKDMTQRATPQPRATYRVKSGDTLGHIAARYKTTVKKIQQWNSLKSTKLRIGQRLVIY